MGAITYHAREERHYDKGTKFTYKYIIKNNVLLLYIYNTIPDGGSGAGQTGGGLYHFSYFYDIKNDKILTISEYVELFKSEIENIENYNYDRCNGYDGCVITINENNSLIFKFSA